MGMIFLSSQKHPDRLWGPNGRQMHMAHFTL